MPFDSDREASLLAKKIKALRAKPHLPPALLDLAEAVYSRQIAARSEAVLAMPGPDHVTPEARHAQGMPLLPREAFLYDKALALRLMDEFTRLLAGAGGPMAEAAGLVSSALAAGEPGFEEAAAAYLRGDDAFFTDFGGKTPAAPRTLAFLVQSSLMPSLQEVSHRLVPEWPEDKTWLYGHCPVCGSPPLIGVLEGKEGRRYLWCSFCSAYYRVQRLPCPLCQEEKTEKLPFYVAEEEPGFRLNMCSTCNKYVKTTDFRDFDRVSLPLLDDLESIALDVLAQKRGFIRPTLSGWGF
jgi:FdhE protein